MKKPRAYRLVVVLGAAFASLGLSCDGGTSTNCRLHFWNQLWESYRFRVIVQVPESCPIARQPLERQELFVETQILTPPSWIGIGPRSAVYNEDGNLVTQVVGTSWYYDPEYDDFYAYTGGSYSVGTGRSPGAYDSFDDLRQVATVDYGEAEGILRVTATFDVGPPIAGPGEVVLNSEGRWLARNQNGVPPFSHNWYVDGSLRQSGSDSVLRYTPMHVGQFTIARTSTDAYSNVANESRTISAVFPVSVAGPNYLNSGEAGTWTVTAQGAAPPYTYRWFVDAQDIGVNLNSFTAVLEYTGGVRRVEAWATDTNGNVGQATIEVVVAGGGCGEMACSPDPGGAKQRP